MNEFNISLSKEQLDIIMKALGELPLKESLPVFNEINRQYLIQVKTLESGKENKTEVN